MEVMDSTVLKNQDLWWERGGISSPALVRMADRYHLIYAAQGEDGISRLGLAVSEDGEIFKRLDQPIFESPDTEPYARLGLVEPRAVGVKSREIIITAIGRSVLMSGVAEAKRIGDAVPWRQNIFVLNTSDLRHFKLTGPVMPNLGCDAAAIFAQPISGRIWLVHSLDGNVLIGHAKSWAEFSGGMQLLSAEGGALTGTLLLGPPPLLTEEGYMLMYGVEKKDGEVAVMVALLAKENPLVVLKKTTEPVWSISSSSKGVSLASLVEDRGAYRLYYSAKGVISLAKFPVSSILASLNA